MAIIREGFALKLRSANKKTSQGGIVMKKVLALVLVLVFVLCGTIATAVAEPTLVGQSSLERVLEEIFWASVEIGYDEEVNDVRWYTVSLDTSVVPSVWDCWRIPGTSEGYYAPMNIISLLDAVAQDFEQQQVLYNRVLYKDIKDQLLSWY